MGFLTGKTEQLPGTSGPNQQLYKGLLDYIQGQGFAGLNPGTQVDSASIEPYLKLFRQNNAQNFAQAKESAGNLTGSGLGNYIGNAAAKADTEQSAFLANLFEQRRQQDANRFLSLVLGSLGSPAGQVTNVYKPGFLDYLGQAGTSLAQGGAFNSLFSSGAAAAA